MDDFAAFILTHGRPDNVKTYKTLRDGGYTGRIVVLIDNTDKTADEYRKRYGDEVEVFDKAAIAKTFDTADNQDDMRTIVYARNACFEVAKRLGIRHFIQLDDDYYEINYRFNHRHEWITSPNRIGDLDRVFQAFVDFLVSTGVGTVAMAQGGDYIGGPQSRSGSTVTMLRKCMNSFVCDTDRPIGFVGRINEDVNTYTRSASVGQVMLTHTAAWINQVTTQAASGGMTSVYRDGGTYIKSFYSVLFHPSSVKVAMMGDLHRRLHHQVNWRQTTPMILSEKHRKASQA